MIDLNIVVTMAGRGSRFYEAGYTVPKYEIVAHGQTLFDWSIESLQNFIGRRTRLIFVCLAENHSADFVRQRSAAMGIEDVHVIELDEVTDGQATSAYLAKGLMAVDAPLLVYNIDTYVRPDALKPTDIKPGSQGWIPCFEAPGDHWSFVRVGADGWADDVAEKQRISSHASVGLYWFATASGYLRAYEAFFAHTANLVKGERYIAPLYRQLLAEHQSVSISELSLDDVHVLGTPAELEVFLGKDPRKIRS